MSWAGAPGGMLLRRGLWLEYATLAWNVAGVVVLVSAAVATGSVAFAGFGVDSLIEIVASAVVVWQLKGDAGSERERRALRVIAIAFVLLAVYIAVQSAILVSARAHPGRSSSGYGLAGGHRGGHVRAGGRQSVTPAGGWAARCSRPRRA